MLAIKPFANRFAVTCDGWIITIVKTADEARRLIGGKC
jgi:hypothetical protein